MTRPSLRATMLASVLATITCGFMALAVYIDHVERANRISDIDEELVRAEAAGGAFAPRPEPTGLRPGSGSTSEATSGGVDPPIHLVLTDDGIVGGTGTEVHPFSDQAISTLATTDGNRTVEVEDHRVRLTRGPVGVTIVTAFPLADHHEAVTNLRRALAVGVGAILVLEGVVVWLLATWLIRPVTEMANAATLIADGALDTEVGPPAGTRETAQLATDLDRMLARLRAALLDRQQLADDATSARAAMQRFLADVSHEIRTPLTAIKGYSGLYQGGMLDEPGALDRAMERIGSESDRLHGLVNQMLELARDNPAPERLDEVDVVAVTRAVAEDLRAGFPHRHIDLDILEPVPPVLGDAARIHQAVLNLGANACRHTPSTEPVTIALHSNASTVVIQVIDHGPGIDESELERIFVPFYQADASRSRNGATGVGLGLAITARIATDHRGTVSAGPTTGGGATFELVLPAIDER